ncbi:YdcF family protein [Methyloligella sp. 2.7D]|uniref:YdcF family protein n=1 Tax=unclassified Methyloligella TaxID=2625955 RepID=UPI00157BCC4A|nr:YdcF family protein [Methyloligella sp. GL2]QKP76469.1 YdcF family protein [Methyloligella sp. GL2]
MDHTVSTEGARTRKRGVLLLAFARLLFNALLLIVVALGVGFLIFVNTLQREKTDPPRADGIAVLTGGTARIDEALTLLSKGKGERVLISGVYPKTTKTELEKLTGEGSQYFSCCVDLDHEAQNTIDNATETSQWAIAHDYRSVIVVTSNYHMPRALAELGRTMPGVTLYPYAVVDKNVHLDHWWLYPGTTKLLLSEYLKYLPALIRLGMTRTVARVVDGDWGLRPEEITEP